MTKYCWVLLFPVMSLPAVAQDSVGSFRQPEPMGTIMSGDASVVLNTASHIFLAPTHWEGRDWLEFGGTFVATGCSALLDDAGFDVVNRNQTPTNDRIRSISVQYGDGLNILLFSAGMYTTGLLVRDNWIRETALLTGTAVLISGTISTVLKVVVGRARPYNDHGNHLFKPFILKDAFHSFPSGHTVVAFSVSTVLSERIHNPWASVGLYVLAGVSSLSRMYSNDHWFSDVVFSGILSTAVAHSVVSWYEGETSSGSTSGMQILPHPGGLTLVWVL